MRLLLVDDEKDFVKALKEILETNHYIVDVAYDGEEALKYINYEHFDCLLLDIMMPKLDGYEVLKRIRANNDNTPVIFLSAKADIDDRVKGFDLGGDDYLPKPFSSKELLARIKALIKRKDGITKNNLEYEGLSLDSKSCSLMYEGKNTPLSNKEYQIIELFLRNPEALYNADKILEEAWSSDSCYDISYVWVFISNLRKKLIELDCPLTIKAIRGLGYKLEKKNV